MSIALAVLAAAASAVASVLQRKAASTEPRDGAGGPGLVRNLARKPVWLGGVAAIAVGFGLHTAALATGPIILVQPILVLELGFALLFASVIFHSRLTAREWTAIAGMTMGLVLLLFSLRPTGGRPGSASGTAWAVGIAVTLAVAALFLWRAHRSSGGSRIRVQARRPAYLGIATGLGFGLTATLVAAVADAFTHRGITGVLTAWQAYLLAVLGPLVFLSLQRTLQAGRLVVSQPAITLANPIVGFGFGVGVFGEDVRTGGWLVGAFVGVALIAGATVALARSPLLHEGAPSAAGADRSEPTV
ncbi:MAG: DMT family transporter [Pseudonocardia sp.]|nr:DMT family transporter [Pseudonocardia sp.]